MKIYIPSPGENIYQVFRRMTISAKTGCMIYFPFKDKVFFAKRETTVRQLRLASRNSESPARLDSEEAVRFINFWEALQKRNDLDKTMHAAELRKKQVWKDANRELHKTYDQLGFTKDRFGHFVVSYISNHKTKRSAY